MDVEAFQKAYATLLHVIAGKWPCADGFTLALRSSKVCRLSSCRGLHTAAGLFTDAASRQSFMWRAVVVMDIARNKKYRNYRNDPAGTMNLALAATVAMVRGSERTTMKELRASFDRLFRRVMKATREWAAANPGLLQRHRLLPCRCSPYFNRLETRMNEAQRLIGALTRAED